MNNDKQTGWFIEWSYSPTDFFEDDLVVEKYDYHLTISSGKIVASISPNAGDPRSNLEEHINDELHAMFVGVQLSSHEPYTLSNPSVHHKDDNGRTVYLETVSVSAKATVSADFRITDKDGNITFDSKAARIEEKHEFASLAAKHSQSDALVRTLLSSYKGAVSDPSNELVHLYEIRDALSKAFSGKREALSNLGIANSDWQELGRLANDSPFHQGRHRGKVTSGLQDASKDDLNTARRIAKEMIVAYLKYLEISTD